MKLTKYGHCALLIEIDDVRLLTDPGSFSSGFEELTNLDAIVITHEHQDHYHVPSLQAVLAKNPGAIVVCNSAVAKLCEVEGIKTMVVDDGQKLSVKNLELEGKGLMHAEIFGEFGMVQNTGYFFGDKLYYPGDAFTLPEREVLVLAVPISAPWLAISHAINFAKASKATYAIPVHDAVLSDKGVGVHYRVFENNVTNMKFVNLDHGKSQEF
jgi:L-ascorbate metabolism protein UlaG (beta-lactamase superfamily)